MTTQFTGETSQLEIQYLWICCTVRTIMHFEQQNLTRIH